MTSDSVELCHLVNDCLERAISANHLTFLHIPLESHKSRAPLTFFSKPIHSPEASNDGDEASENANNALLIENYRIEWNVRSSIKENKLRDFLTAH